MASHSYDRSLDCHHEHLGADVVYPTRGGAMTCAPGDILYSLLPKFLHRQAAVVEIARDILRDADAWGFTSPRIEALRAALMALETETDP